MPSPIETLLRVQASPVPTHTLAGWDGSMAIAPIDCTGCLSKTALKIVPPSVDFHTPPLAAPTNTLSLPEASLTPARADIRPLMAAEPMLRAPRPEMTPESTVTSSACPRHAAPRPTTSTAVPAATNCNRMHRLRRNYFAAAASTCAAGKRNAPSLIVALASALSYCTFSLSVEPFGHDSCARGRYTPSTFS